MEKNQALCYLLHLNNPVKYERDQTLFKNIVFWTSYNFSERKKLTQMCLICRCALYLQMCLICADVPYMCRCALYVQMCLEHCWECLPSWTKRNFK